MPLMTSASGAAPAAIRPGIVHRLDKGTTGLIVVAKDDSALSNLGDQFKAREVRSCVGSCACVPRSSGLLSRSRSGAVQCTLRGHSRGT